MNPELQLRDIHLPAEVSWWPPAIGWWLLAVLLVALLVMLFQRWRSNRSRPVLAVCGPALDELSRLEQIHRHDPARLIREVSVLLRRSAMSLYGRHRVSGLSGDAWLAFLDQQHTQDKGRSGKPADEAIFSGQFRQMLTELPYREHIDASSANELTQAVRQWLQSQQDEQQRSTPAGSASHV